MQPSSQRFLTARSRIAPGLVALTLCLGLFRCALPGRPTEAVLDGVVDYRLDWKIEGTMPLADRSGFEVESDLGYQVRVTEGFLVTRGLQLVPCPGPPAEQKERRASHGSNEGPLAKGLGPTAAWAGHDSGAADPSAIPFVIVEDLLAPIEVTAERSVVSSQFYCQVHYLVARSNDTAGELPPTVDLERTTLLLQGEYRSSAAESGDFRPFALRSSLANGRLFAVGSGLELAAHAQSSVAGSRLEVAVTRDLGRLFDGVDFERMGERDRARAVLRSLVKSARVEVEAVAMAPEARR